MIKVYWHIKEATGLFDYTGSECKSCGEKFTAEDDIVVCPECGTPYHRECWKREGECINTELHESGKSWKELNEKTAEMPKCKGCGNTLRDDQLFCDKCGAPTDAFFSNGKKAGEAHNSQGAYRQVSENTASTATENMYPFMINFSDPLCGFNPEEELGTEEDSATVRELGDFVGSNTHYYLPKFRNIKKLGLKFSINIPAMIFPELYFAYRKMPLIAIAVLILRTLIEFPSELASYQMIFADSQPIMGDFTYRTMFESMFPYLAEPIERLLALDLKRGAFATVDNIAYILTLARIFITASFSNFIYYRHAVKKVTEVKKNTADKSRLSYSLKESGGTSAALLITFIVLLFAMDFVSMAGVFFVVS